MTDSNLHEAFRPPVLPIASQESIGQPFKRKPDQKSNYKSATDEEDIESVPSIKSSSNPPLPELQRQKRKLLVKPFGSMQSKGQYGFIEKEVRQHDNILLKQRNNLVSSENMKLKTRITVLQKQNERLQKILDNETSQLKPSTVYNLREKIRPADATLRAVIRGLRKELEDLRKENLNIKSAVKFTSLKELEAERDQLAQETIRMRLMLEEEQAKRSTLKANFHGVSALEHRLHQLSERNSILTREHNELQEKCKKLEDGAARAARALENEKGLRKAIANLRKTLGEKDSEIELLKGQMKTSSNIGTSNSLIPPSNNRLELRRPSIERKNKIAALPSRPEAKSAQKIKESTTCSRCPKLQAEIKTLAEKVKQLEGELEKLGKGSLIREPVPPATEEQVAQLKRFLTLRFKAHRLSYEESQRYLVNCEGSLDEAEKKKEMTVRELIQSLFVEPFCIVSNRYLEVFVVRLVYGSVKEAVTLEQGKKTTKGGILAAYAQLMPKYEVMSQEKEEEMFIQVAELITTYYQQIMAALTAKKNGQGTIPEKFFLEFFGQIQLEQEYIDFIITQIILESIDMDHLNFYAMFEIFYMPQMTNPNPTNKKKRFQVANENVVHEQDEEYEESKSHLGSRNKTLQHREEHDEEEYGWQQEQEESRVDKQKDKQKEVKEKNAEKEKNGQKQKQKEKQKEEEEYYQQEYQQEKMQNEIVEPKAKPYVIDEEYGQ